MKPTKTAEQFAKELLERIEPSLDKQKAEMEIELLNVEENGVESCDYYNWDNHSIDIYQFDVAGASWGSIMFIPALDFFEYKYNLDYDTDIVLDDQANMLDIGEIWDELYKYSSDVADELTKQSGVDGQFFFGHLEGDSSFGLFYSKQLGE